MRSRLTLCACTCAALAVFGCEATEEAVEGAEPRPAPVASRATLVLEPAVLYIGDVTTLEIAAVTAPEVRVTPISPAPVPGIELLGVRALPTETGERRWIHRTELRLRAREVGVRTWPGFDLATTKPDGTTETIRVDAQPFEVRSVRPEHPDRRSPFGLQRPSPARSTDHSGFWSGVAAGTLVVVAGGLCALGVLRRRRSAHARPEPLPLTLIEWTEAELERALAVLESDPRRAASAGSHLLRTFMARRFGSDTEASTTEELEQHSPALAEQALWPDFVRILHSFDDERFRPQAADPSRAAAPRKAGADRIRSALEASRRLLTAATPLDSRAPADARPESP